MKPGSRLLRLWPLALCGLVLVVSCTLPPVIEDIQASRWTINQNDTLYLTAVVTSESGVSYYWSVASGGGDLDQPNANPVMFTAPKLAGPSRIALRVVDAHAVAADDTVTVIVQ